MTVNDISSNTLTSKQAAFCDALLLKTTLVVAAKTAGISERTAVRWKQDPTIIAAVKERRAEQFNETLDAFRAGLPDAMHLVLETIKDKETPRSIRLRAAQIWIEQALQVHQVEQLAEEVEQLKAMVLYQEQRET